MKSHSVIQLLSLAQGLRIDPEYYQPRYLEDSKRLAAFDCAELNSMAFVTDGIHGSPDEVDEGGVLYLSAKCVKTNDFSLGSAISISEKQHRSNPRTSLQADDVLITTVGTIGNAAVVQEDILPANSDRHLGIIRVKSREIDPYFLATFLNSEYGRFQSTREATGNVQLNLFIEKIKLLSIPRLKCAPAVAGLTRSAYSERLKAMRSVEEAQNIVSEAVSVGKDDLKPSLTYVSRLSEMTEGRRLGAEFYMPAKARVLAKLTSEGCLPLSEYAINVRQMWNPATHQGTVRNFDLGDALEPFLDDRFEPVSADTILSAKKRLRRGDVVISRLRSYLKQIAVVRCEESGDIVGSSEFVVLRSKGALAPETLLAFLRSEPVQTILQWSQDGTNHPRFDEATLLALPIPQAILDQSARISGSIGAAIEARQKMALLLKEAEGLINSEISSVK